MRYVFILLQILSVCIGSTDPRHVQGQVDLRIPGTAESQTAHWALPTLAGVGQIRLEGYNPMLEIPFALPQGWNIQEAQVLVQYQVSNLIHTSATLTIAVNGQDIQTIPLVPAGESVRIPLPREALRAGQNQLSIRALLALQNDASCLRPGDAARWISIEPTSTLQVRIDPATEPLQLSSFPAAFELGGGLAQEIQFVVPEQPDDQELSALSRIAYSIAQATTTQLAWKVVSDTAFNTATSQGPVVLLGVTMHNRHLAAFVPEDHPDSWASLSRPAWSRGYPVLALGGTDSAMVLRAATELAHAEARAVLAQETASITSVTPYETPRSMETFTLAEIANNDRNNDGKVRGSGYQSLSYPFDLPLAWAQQDGQLDLEFVQSRSLQPAQSFLTILLNSQRIMRIQLDAHDSMPHRLRVLLPAMAFQAGRNLLQFEFSLSSARCGLDAPEGYWAQIRSQSRLTLSHGIQKPFLDLRNVPQQFSAASDVANLLIVLPDQSTIDDYEHVLRFVRHLSISASALGPQWIHSASMNADSRQHNMIVIGSFEQQALLAELNPFLPVAFHADTGMLQSSVDIPGPVAANASIFEILRSPWATERVILVVSGTNSAYSHKAIQVLDSTIVQTQLAGQAALITEEQSVQRVYPLYRADLSTIPGLGILDQALRRLTSLIGPWPIVVVPLLVLLVFALCSTPVLRWWNTQRQGESGEH